MGVQSIFYNKGYIYLLNDLGQFVVVDVRDLKNPKLVKILSTILVASNSVFSFDEDENALYVSNGNNGYPGGGGSTHIEIWTDLSDPSDPKGRQTKDVSFLNISNFYKAHHYRKHYFIDANIGAHQDPNNPGVTISSKDSTILDDSLQEVGSLPAGITGNFGKNVVFHNNYMYVGRDEEIRVFDITDIEHPKILPTRALRNQNDFNLVESMELIGKTLYVISGFRTLTMVDIGDETSDLKRIVRMKTPYISAIVAEIKGEVYVFGFTELGHINDKRFIITKKVLVTKEEAKSIAKDWTYIP